MYNYYTYLKQKTIEEKEKAEKEREKKYKLKKESNLIQ